MCGIIELPILNLSNKQISIKPKRLIATVDKLQDKHLPSLSKKTRTSMENKMIDSETCINFEVGDAVLTNAQKAKLRLFLYQNRDIFASSLDELGVVNLFEHRIEVDPTVPPIQARPYRHSPKMINIINEQVAELEQLGFVVPSNSAWSSPCLLVPKKGEKEEYRLCIDYRLLNSVTKNIYFQIPTIEDILDSMGEMQPKIFSTLDAYSGYYQMEIEKDSRQYTAFVTTEGVYEFTRMRFGL